MRRPVTEPEVVDSPAATRATAGARLWRSGVPFVWLTGSALALALLMIVGLVGLVAGRGLSAFWPARVVKYQLADGGEVLGEIWMREEGPEGGERVQLRVGNRDFYGADFRWIDRSNVVGVSFPPDVVTIERAEWGNFHGRLAAVHVDGEIVAEGAEASWQSLRAHLPEVRRNRSEVERLEREQIATVSSAIESARLELRRLDLEGGARPAERGRLEEEIRTGRRRYESLVAELEVLRREMRDDVVVLREAGGREKAIPMAGVVRAFQPNDLGLFGQVSVYASRIYEFVTGEPRESNTEGGVFPAIFGTFLMVVLMSLAAVPFGVLAAIYLHEYARQGFFVRVVRIAVNNLAGVPSIVFGVFGLGFFVYFVGGTIDQLFYPERLPAPTYGTGGILWASLTLALLTVPVVIVATEEALAGIPREVREGSLALGATHWETIRRVLVPASLPGILTGTILAMARGAGEVAPLMITGVVKLAPTLPIDGEWPYLHLERKFMHLGFHIYDVGFQSPNVEAAKPMVFTTTLLLLAVVLTINVIAMLVRSRLRARHRTAGV